MDLGHLFVCLSWVVCLSIYDNFVYLSGMGFDYLFIQAGLSSWNWVIWSSWMGFGYLFIWA
jgi:hypothetical protein